MEGFYLSGGSLLEFYLIENTHFPLLNKISKDLGLGIITIVKMEFI